MTILNRRGIVQRLLAAIGFVSVSGHAQAQDVRAGAGRPPTGLRATGNEFFFETPTGLVAATRLGVYTPPMQEPTRPDQSGAMWAFVSGTADDFVWELKLNISGSIFTLSRGKWSLSQQ